MIGKDNPRRVLKYIESTDFLQACTLLHTRQRRLDKVAAGVKDVAFDRSGFRYHGRIKVLAEAAREVGLNF